MTSFDDEHPVTPDGLTIRRRRRARGWSRRELALAIARAREVETGVAETLPPALLKAIEETNEPVPYTTLGLIASGLDCNPVELLGQEVPPEPEPGTLLH